MTSPPLVNESDHEVLGLARGGALNVAGAVVSQAAGFALTLILSRTLGASAAGLYFQGFAFLSILGLLSLSGFRGALTRFVAIHLADRDPGALRGTLRLGLGLSAGASTLFGAVLLVTAPWLADHAFGDARLAMPLSFVALTLPASVFSDAALSATQGFRTMKAFAAIGLIFEPLLRVALTGAALAAGADLRGAMAALLVSNYAAGVLAALALRRLVGRPRERPHYLVRELFAFSGVSWMSSLASTGLIWADIILLGLFTDSRDVGVYGVATRLVTLAALVMPPINASFAPRIADLHRRAQVEPAGSGGKIEPAGSGGKMESLQRTYSAAAGWILRLSLPAFVVCWVLPGQLLAVFGTEFEAGVAVVMILAAGKIVDCATGPCALMLNMSGRQLFNMIDNIGVLIANVLLNLWLIPRHGITGSAVAWAVSLALVNVARVLQVRAVLGMLPFGIGEAKAALAGLAAAGLGVLAVNHTQGPVTLVAGISAIVASYVLLVALLGVGQDDRLVLRSIIDGARGGLGRPGGRRATTEA